MGGNAENVMPRHTFSDIYKMYQVIPMEMMTRVRSGSHLLLYLYKGIKNTGHTSMW